MRPYDTIELLKRFGWEYESANTTTLVSAIYLAWIYGASTRNLGRVLGCDKNTVIGMLERVYGLNAVNRSAKSLLISLAEDYPECPVTENFIRSNLGIEEQKEGEISLQYTSIYANGKAVVKTLKVPKYQQHRSENQMQQISRAQAKSNLVLDNLTEEEYRAQ